MINLSAAEFFVFFFFKLRVTDTVLKARIFFSVARGLIGAARAGDTRKLNLPGWIKTRTVPHSFGGSRSNESFKMLKTLKFIDK